MAVVVQKALAIANRDASPKVISFSNIVFGDSKENVGVVPVASTDSVGSSYYFGTLPSNARMSKVWAAFSALTGATMDIGLYQTEAAFASPGVAVDAHFWANALVLTTATATAPLDLTYNGTQTLDKGELMLWQALGLATDPVVYYDVIGILQHVSATSGFVNLRLDFAQ